MFYFSQERMQSQFSTHNVQTQFLKVVGALHNRDVCLLVDVVGGDGDVDDREEEDQGRHHHALWGLVPIRMWARHQEYSDCL